MTFKKILLSVLIGMNFISLSANAGGGGSEPKPKLGDFYYCNSAEIKYSTFISKNRDPETVDVEVMVYSPITGPRIGRVILNESKRMSIYVEPTQTNDSITIEISYTSIRTPMEMRVVEGFFVKSDKKVVCKAI